MSRDSERAVPAPLVQVVLVERRHARDCQAWNVAPPYDCTCGLETTSALLSKHEPDDERA